jgi:hypothetical protein
MTGMIFEPCDPNCLLFFQVKISRASAIIPFASWVPELRARKQDNSGIGAYIRLSIAVPVSHGTLLGCITAP